MIYIKEIMKSGIMHGGDSRIRPGIDNIYNDDEDDTYSFRDETEFLEQKELELFDRLWKLRRYQEKELISRYGKATGGAQPIPSGAEISANVRKKLY